jgi:hypothetical protein
MDMTKEQKNADIEKYRPTVDISSLLKFVVNHPGLAVFMVYATIAIAGFIYIITFYQHFGLDVIVYLEIGDILVAGIKDPMVMLMVLSSFLGIFLAWLYTYFLAPFHAWLDKKFNKGFFSFLPYAVGLKSTRSFWWTSLLMVIIYFVWFISIHSETKSSSIKNDKAKLVVVDSGAISDKNQQYSLLGTSINYIFLYNHKDESTLIIPLENVNSLKPVNFKLTNKVQKKPAT